MQFAQHKGVVVRVDLSADWKLAETNTLVGVELFCGREENLAREGGFVVDVKVSTFTASRHGGASEASCPVVRVRPSVAGRSLCGVRQRSAGVTQGAAGDETPCRLY